jgi:hypothetical protein
VTVVVDTPEYQIIRNVSAAGFTDQWVWKAGTAGANQQTVAANVAAALVRLRQIQTQAQAFQAVAPYGAATLANLNDLLTKCQQIAAAVNDLAVDLVGLARIASNQFDGTT